MIDLEDESIDAEVMDSLAVSMDNFRVSFTNITLFHFLSIQLNIRTNPKCTATTATKWEFQHYFFNAVGKTWRSKASTDGSYRIPGPFSLG